MEMCNKITVSVLIIVIIISLISFVYAQEISSKEITAITNEIDSEFIFDKIQKIYEISDSGLEKGYSAVLNEKDAFRLNIRERNYYIIVWNITKDEAHLVFPGKRALAYEVGSIALIDIDQDNKLDIQLELKSIEEYYGGNKAVASVELGNETAKIKDIEYIPNKKVNLYIKKIIEKELIPEGEYFELFDLTVRLAEEKIYNSRDLNAFIIFENFGEGPSEIDIVYSIINEKGSEVYRGIDSKVVQTEDRVAKDFNFLELPIGKYILRAEIFYGQNQTGESEQDFEIVKMPFINQLGGPLFFISTIIILFILVRYGERIYGKSKYNQIKKGGNENNENV